ncbi:hypothetical protein [Lacimicrobium alkaliphilum]|uniref:Type 4 fimbrial biogenesis protein PilX N-terminal domain-containing protein n=1 Tax=Lacimicrobium alkaliphilum TaxID=1526571 RepID=A0ABQ1RFG6_9ALTE|nr:hypothetical protein [Lacimicrobium alkaliphilum]GGD66395.1 hypothetical protein GCM10011357_22070 [Lacimicrobium alkaliphilum]
MSVVLLLVMALMVTLYTGRVKSLQYKTLLNEQNYIMAFAAAEAGLMKALGRLSEDPEWDASQLNETLPGNLSYSVTGTRSQIDRQSATFTVVDLESLGTSADGLAQAIIRESALLYLILANQPDAPLIVAGGLAVSGNFEVAANANGGGTGVPLSIWTDQTVDMNAGSGTTCGLQEFYDGNCSAKPYSEKGVKSPDILDNDPGLPNDLMEYLFNVPQSEWSHLRADADQRLVDCSTLSAGSVGLIWVDGQCTLNAGNVVGSADAPVILIVSDGDISMKGGARVFGILFSFRKSETLADFEIDMTGNAVVVGAVVSNHPVGHANGSYKAVYGADVLQSIEQHQAFKRIGRIPGSWRDY